ncbi:hypothetical protein Cgig2_014446 [Carnegiea gigantea]|uniref:Transposase n=1 Tax=Carnegiea gigantea TaxID=171969 RepID=A0A9Q1K345_9CARY|nr:hypothetical protein Cgig2_014446 [Carnegiea gigantea]
MSNLRADSSTKKQTTLTNEYENERISRIRENKLKLQSLGIKRIATSLTSLVDDTNVKRAKEKQKSQMDNNVEYVPCCNDADEERNSSGNELREQESSTKPKGSEMKQTIAPMSMANFLLMSKKQQRAVVGDKALKQVAAAFKAVEIVMSNQQQLDKNITANHEETNEQLFAENIYGDTHGFLDEQEFSDDDYDHVNLEIDEADQESGTTQTVEAQNLSSGNQAGSNEERRPINLDQNLTSTNQGTGNNESELNTTGITKKTRGIVYCRKLTTLPPGEKLTVEFDNDGIPVGANGSSFSFFLGHQVRNRIVIPVQVSGWDEIKPEALEHLWSCVQGFFSFDSPELRKNAILRDVRALFRDRRHMLKHKYFDNPKLKTKADRMKNRPAYMLDVDWKYLVNLWSSPEFQKEKYGRECSRLDLMLKSRTRTSDKPVNIENLANNMHAKDKHGYLRAYGRGKSITDYFGVKPSCLDLAQDVMELKKRADASIMEAKKDLEAEQAKKEAEEARKEAETTRQEVDAKIEANNKMLEKKMKNMFEEFLRSSTHVNVLWQVLWLTKYVAMGTQVARSRFAMRLPVAHRSTLPQVFLWLQFFL